jgi:hypothetical protein
MKAKTIRTARNRPLVDRYNPERPVKNELMNPLSSRWSNYPDGVSAGYRGDVATIFIRALGVIELCPLSVL